MLLYIQKKKRKKKLDFLQEKSKSDHLEAVDAILRVFELLHDEIGTTALQTLAQRKGMKINQSVYGKRRLNEEVKWYEDENEDEKKISVFRV